MTSGMATRGKALKRGVTCGRQDTLRDQLSDLTLACPLHRDNPQDCPLFPLRNMPSKKRNQWFAALSDDDLAYLAAYHHVCLAVKLKTD
jgi:hypothetical protein